MEMVGSCRRSPGQDELRRGARGNRRVRLRHGRHGRRAHLRNEGGRCFLYRARPRQLGGGRRTVRIAAPYGRGGLRDTEKQVKAKTSSHCFLLIAFFSTKNDGPGLRRGHVSF